jgi:alpha/beta superfamily hydrolase
LVEKGIATVRFDFRGSGDSEGEFSEMSPLTELRDAEEVYSFVGHGNGVRTDWVS